MYMSNYLSLVTRGIIAITILFGLLLLFAPDLVMADAKSEIQSGINQASGGKGSADPAKSLNETIESIINILSSIIGVIAVIMIIIAGARYVTSGGNDTGVAAAKKTLLYALIGLVIVALAQVIVKFVINNVI
jgi:hypothetical protein